MLRILHYFYFHGIMLLHRITAVPLKFRQKWTSDHPSQLNLGNSSSKQNIEYQVWSLTKYIINL